MTIPKSCTFDTKHTTDSYAYVSLYCLFIWQTYDKESVRVPGEFTTADSFTTSETPCGMKRYQRRSCSLSCRLQWCLFVQSFNLFIYVFPHFSIITSLWISLFSYLCITHTSSVGKGLSQNYCPHSAVLSSSSSSASVVILSVLSFCSFRLSVCHLRRDPKLITRWVFAFPYRLSFSCGSLTNVHTFTNPPTSGKLLCEISSYETLLHNSDLWHGLEFDCTYM